MLNLLETRIVATQHADTAPGVLIADEGIALVWAKVDGKAVVQPSSGAAGEEFAGVSYSRSGPAVFLPAVEQGVLPVGASLKLSRKPLAGQILVKAGNQVLSAGNATPTDDTTYQLLGDGQTLQMFGDLAGKQITVQYMYTPTAAEAIMYAGSSPIGGNPSQFFPRVGRLTDAIFGTNYCDFSKDWTDTLYVKLGANGMFEPATASDGLPFVIVMNSPNVANPFLVLNIKSR